MTNLLAHDHEYVNVDASSSGANTLRAAVANKRIVVITWHLVAASAVVAKFRSGVTDIGGGLEAGDTTGHGPEAINVGHFRTANGAALNLDLGGAVQVRGYVVIALSDDA